MVRAVNQTELDMPSFHWIVISFKNKKLDHYNFISFYDANMSI